MAKNFDGPIKLLFPRALDAATGKRLFSMLGLGDIVIPGIFVALMLRMDVGNNFAHNYFRSAFGGYVLGLATTIVVMNVFNAAQPALLYIVPAILGSVALHAWSKGKLLQVRAASHAWLCGGSLRHLWRAGHKQTALARAPSSQVFNYSEEAAHEGEHQTAEAAGGAAADGQPAAPAETKKQQ